MNSRLFIKTFLYSLTVLCAVSFLILSSLNDKSIQKSGLEESEKTSYNTIIPDEEELSHYLIKLEENVVKVYEIYSDSTKVQSGTLDIPLNTLRELDRAKFENGIILENASDILHIAEDFSS